MKRGLWYFGVVCGGFYFLFLCFRFDALTELGAFMRTEFLCISVLRVASGPRVKLASCKSALNTTVVYSTDRSKAVVPVLVLLFVALWFILLCFLSYIVLFCSCVFSPFSIAITSLREERELILVLFVRLFDLRLFGFVCFLFLLVSGKDCGFWLWHSLDFSLTFFVWNSSKGIYTLHSAPPSSPESLVWLSCSET